MAGRHRGLTLVEIMVVTCISVMLIGVLIRFFISTQRTSHHGLDRLESLRSARLVSESVTRDLKLLCFNDRIGFTTTNTGGKQRWLFPLFADKPTSFDDRNPVNKVVYEYDPQAKTLSRELIVNQSLRNRQQSTRRIIGKHIESFQIVRRNVFTYPAYFVEVRSRESAPPFICALRSVQSLKCVSIVTVSRFRTTFRHPKSITDPGLLRKKTC